MLCIEIQNVIFLVKLTPVYKVWSWSPKIASAPCPDPLILNWSRFECLRMPKFFALCSYNG